MADLVLLLHFAFVLFVVGGLIALAWGLARGARWTLRRGFRAAHLAAVAWVVVQGWLGRVCPLTHLENWLRVAAGEPPYATTFLGHWVGRLLYCDAPGWAFTAAYTAFGALVVLANALAERRRTTAGRAGA